MVRQEKQHPSGGQESVPLNNGLRIRGRPWPITSFEIPLPAHHAAPEQVQTVVVLLHTAIHKPYSNL